MPRFVILEHDHPERHWDFLLEAGDVLRAWRLAESPQPGRTVAAAASFDHRRLYLDYEGPISGGRGRVCRWDAGTFAWQKDLPDDVAIFLEGTRVRGQAILQRDPRGNWFLAIEARPATAEQPGVQAANPAASSPQ